MLKQTIGEQQLEQMQSGSSRWVNATRDWQLKWTKLFSVE